MDDMRGHIRESNLIEGITDPGEIDQSFISWRTLLEQPVLTHEAIRRAQAIVCHNQRDLADNQKGFYRSESRVDVRVGSHVAPPWQKVDALMESWLAAYPARAPWGNHVDFEHIHPFRAGNGRAGRMIMWWQEVREGHAPTLFKRADRFDYYERLQRGRASEEDREAEARRMLALINGWSDRLV